MRRGPVVRRGAMNLVDSSGWIEFFNDGPYASYFLEALRDMNKVIVPTLCFYEVFSYVMKNMSDAEALQVVAFMQQSQSVDLTDAVAVLAARLSAKHNLPFSPGITLATAQLNHAVVWTQDPFLKDFPDVKYYPKKKD
ncbi:type II toxin-antitoxin system VapC family toxin [Prosthecochloris sp. SCSIO W1101]|uniref:type II toxin-antitoxin system VapC family toxin n=1 Tax=Prosthecochloris sp. SCSIO W1101 TaxID=2992242 RepID=UPI00223D7602|nr:type II toxin-antitoxin system VapC family toxin [Prosthecochloris sp. SCSIO W1101]UZJ42591.1 type II toxin-antitoxin system VapC family toxin [Prosthecochloris sp. SCSIO W1101]